MIQRLCDIKIPVNLKTCGIAISFITTIFLSGMGWSALNTKLNSLEQQVKDQSSEISELASAQSKIQGDLAYIRGKMDILVKPRHTVKDNVTIGHAR